MDYFSDVPARVPPSNCAKCRKALLRMERIHAVKIVAGVGKSPRAFGDCVYVSVYEELAHVRCEDPGLSGPFIELPRSMLVVSQDIQAIPARTPDYVCAVCQKRLQREDRIFLSLIVEGVGRDARTEGKAIQCAAEYEVVHVSCRDPKLLGGVT